MVQMKKMGNNSVRIDGKVVDNLMDILQSESSDQTKMNRLANIVQKMVDTMKQSVEKKERKLSDYQKFIKSNYKKHEQEVVRRYGEEARTPKNVLKFAADEWKRVSGK